MQEGALHVRFPGEEDLASFHQFLRDCPFGDVLQTAAWARLKQAYGWKPHFLAAEDGRSVRAVCLVLERKLPKLPFTILYCPRGPALDWREPGVLRPLVRELNRLARRRKAILVKIDPPVAAGMEDAVRTIEAAGMHRAGAGGFGGTQPRCVMKLDIAGGAEAAFERFKPKWRYNIRLAERKGVEVTEGTQADIDAFYDLLLETARRDRFLVRGRDYFHTMWDELDKDGLIRLFLAKFDGTLVAGALLYVMGRQAWYTYGASSNEHRNVMPNHLMQWRMIKEAADAGCSVYDFRGVSCSQETNEGDHLQGLNRFKAGFSAEFIEYAGEYDLPISGTMYFAWAKMAPAALKLLKRKAAAEGD